MRSWKVKLSLAAVLLPLLLLCGCDNEGVVLENPLPFVIDDRVIGSWSLAGMNPPVQGISDDIGKLQWIIRRSDNELYEAQSPEDIQKGQKPSFTFHLAKVGNVLLAEQPVDCNNYYFKSTDTSTPPKGCWSIFRIVFTGNSMEFDMFDPNQLVLGGLTGTLKGMDMEFGGSATRLKTTDSASTAVLLRGQQDIVAPFLATYASGAVYNLAMNFRRI